MFAVQFLKIALIALVSIGAVTLTSNQTRLTVETVETTLSDTVLGKKGPNENASDRAKENAAKNAPKVSNFIMPPDGVYEIGDILTFTMEFDKPITVNGSEAVHGFGLSNNDIQWTYTGHSDEVLDMAYDRNGNLFTASEDGTIHQLNATNGQFIQSFNLGSPVFGVAVAAHSNLSKHGQPYLFLFMGEQRPICEAAKPPHVYADA